MAYDQFKTLDEKIQYVLANQDKIMKQRIEKVDKKIEKYQLNIDDIYVFGKQQDLKGLRVLFSNLKHRYKYHDLNDFLATYLNEKKKEQARELGEVGFIFYIAMMEEVCNRHSIVHPDFIQVEESTNKKAFYLM